MFICYTVLFSCYEVGVFSIYGSILMSKIKEKHKKIAKKMNIGYDAF